ncbi:uncharacterized protein K452DRAFT_151771 [Aplosporella prunicola CBS 121167]|uniref:Uncharacterized protein n=1 Tax=Aplosporella prunicola CBS 121167 TaxID=1176127 RepID=A0A6A6BIT0_9PEZI|nr:uncharacterized protein K452DRAFT_151771 [Aplosporella prunicola CBS 121167]KAF2144040.1 hypothetical protein K452DRAFT_151771 [Aplosporella prunicola CBS 121167]
MSSLCRSTSRIDKQGGGARMPKSMPARLTTTIPVSYSHTQRERERKRERESKSRRQRDRTRRLSLSSPHLTSLLRYATLLLRPQSQTRLSRPQTPQAKTMRNATRAGQARRAPPAVPQALQTPPNQVQSGTDKVGSDKQAPLT